MTTPQIILTILLSIVWATVIDAIRRVIRRYKSTNKKLSYSEMSEQLKFHAEKARELDGKLKEIDNNTQYSSGHNNIYNGSFDELLEHRKKEAEYGMLKALDLSRTDKHDDEIIRIGDGRKIIPNIDKDGKIRIEIGDRDSHYKVLSPECQEELIKQFKAKEPVEIKSASLDHISIGLNGIGLGLKNIEYKDHMQDSVEMLNSFSSEGQRVNVDFVQSDIESNTSDTCYDSSSVDFGGGDSGGSGSGNDF